MIHGTAQATTSKHTDAATNADDVAHIVTMTLDEFHSEKWRQINALLVWNVTRTMADDSGNTSFSGNEVVS